MAIPTKANLPVEEFQLDQARTIKLVVSDPTFAATHTLPSTTGQLLGTGAQTLTTEEKAQARANIGAGTGSGGGGGGAWGDITGTLSDQTDLQAALDAKATTSALTSHTGNTSNPHSVTATQVGLGNVDNTSDANKPVSTATQTALDLKAALASPTFTGTPAAPTAAAATNTTQLATTAHVFAERTNSATLTNKTLTSPTINSGAVSGTFTGAATWSGVQTWNNNAVLTKSSLIGSGITYLLNASYTAAPASTDQPYGVLSSLTFNGSATPSGSEHGAAVLGRFFDGTSNRHGGIGVEGKVDATGLSSYTGVAGDTGFQGSAFTGQTLNGFAVTRMSITTDGTTPLAQGTAVGLYVPNFVGGALKLGIFSKEQVRVDNTITAYSTSGTGGTYMSHNGTDGVYATVSGNMYFTAASGASYVLINAAALAPLSDGLPLGVGPSNRWAVAATTVNAATSITLGTVTWTTGSGSPESVVTAPVGSIYSRTDGSTSTTLYVKTSGAGNTGWTAK